MRPYDPTQLIVAKKHEEYENPYDKLSVEERWERYLSTQGGRKNTRDFLESMGRLMSTSKGAKPLTSEDTNRIFRWSESKKKFMKKHGGG